LTLATLLELFHPCCLLNIKQGQMMLASVASVKIERTSNDTNQHKRYSALFGQMNNNKNRTTLVLICVTKWKAPTINCKAISTERSL